MCKSLNIALRKLCKHSIMYHNFWEEVNLLFEELWTIQYPNELAFKSFEIPTNSVSGVQNKKICCLLKNKF